MNKFLVFLKDYHINNASFGIKVDNISFMRNNVLIIEEIRDTQEKA